MTRREELYPVIRRLREDEGLMWREISERLGLARATAHEYYSDPTGEQTRKRKARYERPCDMCGKPLKLNGFRPDTTTCARCLGAITRDASKAWILDSFAEWSQRFGAPPSSVDWNPADARVSAWKAKRYKRTGRKWPSPTLVTSHFGSWNAGLRAAGFEPLSKQEHPLGHAGRALREQDAA
jgi:hypothetical protein